MVVHRTNIEGVLILEPRVFQDARGYFLESFSQRDFDAQVAPILGHSVTFVQDNESMSSYGVVRGLHFQKPPFTQSKLVRCVRGRVLDVAVDIRRGSPTYGKHVAVELSEENHRQFFVSKGFAHGFAVLSETAVFQYKCDEFYHPEADAGIQLLDPALGIDWGVPEAEMIMSEKDRVRLKLESVGSIFFSYKLEITKYGVTLKRLTHDKIELVRRWRNDPKIQKYMEFREEITPEMQNKWYQRISQSGTDFYFIMVIDSKEIGLINIRDVDFEAKEGEPGIFIWDDDYLNSDASFRASLCLLDFVFEDLGLERLVAHVMNDNKRAIDFNLFWGYELAEGQENVQNQKYFLRKERYFEKKKRIVRLFNN